jgi:hypothetical protein
MSGSGGGTSYTSSGSYSSSYPGTPTAGSSGYSDSYTVTTPAPVVWSSGSGGGGVVTGGGGSPTVTPSTYSISLPGAIAEGLISSDDLPDLQFSLASSDSGESFHLGRSIDAASIYVTNGIIWVGGQIAAGIMSFGNSVQNAAGYTNGFNQFIGTALNNVVGETNMANATNLQIGVGLTVFSAAVVFVGWGAAGTAAASGSIYVGAGVLTGATNGFLSVQASDISSGTTSSWGSYAIGTGLGAVFGAMNPTDAFASLGGGLLGAAAGGASAQSAARGYLIGSSLGGILSPGIADLMNKAPVMHVLSRGLVSVGGWGATVGITMANGGNLDTALFLGNFGAMASSSLSRLIKCFPAGTPILTPDGSKPIEQLRAGDVVFSRSEHNVEGPVGPKVIEETFAGQSEVLQLSIGGQTIRTTPEHPFYEMEKGWVGAGDLAAGDLLATNTGNWLKIDAVTWTGEIVPVYNFRVSDYHTYFIGDPDWAFGIWVHNTYVYASRSATTGQINYIGITDNPTARFGAHARAALGVMPANIPGLSSLTRADARAVEQVLIEKFMLGKNGGNLLNKINSIASTNPNYTSSIATGKAILKNLGILGF